MNWNYLGFNFASWYNGKFTDSQSSEALKQLEEISADTATIVATNYVQSAQSSEIFAESRTEPLENVEKAITDAQDRGLNVWLKPHLDIQNGQWRGEFDPTDREAFFENYKSFIVDYAQLAQKNDVEVLTIGTELKQLTGESDRAAWEDIIQEIRQVYDGKLTYAADWSNVDNISFAGSLDLLGVNPYFPLTANENASVEELVEAWTAEPEIAEVSNVTGGQSIVDYIRGASEKYGKPIVSTELGYRSLNDTAEKPFEFGTDGQPDEVEQARLYEAFFKVFGGETGEDVEFFKGAQMWNWYATEAQNNDPTDIDYPILGKQAEEVFQEYSNKLLNSNSSIPETTETSEPLEPLETPEISELDQNQSTDISGIEFTIEDDWSSGHRGEVSITNESNSTLDNWTLEFKYDGDITQIWNAEIVNQEGDTYIISHEEYNGMIEPNETVSFGFVAAGSAEQEPSVFDLNGQTI